MLFEGRLNGQVYRPIGEEWYEKGFWKIYDHPATVQQYLGIGGNTPDGSPKLNEVLQKEGFLYHCHDIEGNRTNKAITFEGFMLLHIDIVIASIPAHVEPFKKLCEMHPDHPKLIYQIGNAWDIPFNSVKNVMASALIPNVPEDINFVSYHQEFDLSTFHPPITGQLIQGTNDYWNSYNFDVPEKKNIYSFVNCFNTQDHLKSDWELFKRLEIDMPDFKFRSYGGQCRDGNCNGSEELAVKMREAMFIWHTKAGGDGYGHVIHNAAAVGRPLIVKKQYYQGKMAEALIKDEITAIVIDGLDNQEIMEKINFYSEPERYRRMAKEAYDNFIQVVNFDNEELKIRAFLDRLI